MQDHQAAGWKSWAWKVSLQISESGVPTPIPFYGFLFQLSPKSVQL